MSKLARRILEGRGEINLQSREYLWMAGLAGYLGAGDKAGARRFWDQFSEDLKRSAPKAAFRLLRCHAESGDLPARASACASAFSAYARR
jgi:hypothetical protein